MERAHSNIFQKQLIQTVHMVFGRTVSHILNHTNDCGNLYNNNKYLQCSVTFSVLT